MLSRHNFNFGNMLNLYLNSSEILALQRMFVFFSLLHAGQIGYVGKQTMPIPAKGRRPQ